MISYDKVILKRLRFKGEPPVPSISAAEIGLVPRSEGDAQVNGEHENEQQGHLSQEIAAEAPSGEPADERTEAEKRFEEQTAQQRMERLRAAARTTYKKQVEKFNERLSNEPDHYDMFKVSLTK